MLNGMRGLIQETFHITGSVAYSAGQVKNGSADLIEKAMRISVTMGD